MTRIQRRWLIVDTRTNDALRKVRRLAAGDGVLVLHGNLSKGARSRLMRSVRRAAKPKGVTVIDGLRDAARVHDLGDLRRALQARTPFVFLSPMFPTRSHPDWLPIPRLRAASLARLAGRNLWALGGMDAERYARVRPLGFIGWAGIDAF